MDYACPTCGSDVGPALGWHGSRALAHHTERDCPECLTPLIVFQTGAMSGRWHRDEAKQPLVERLPRKRAA